MTREIFLQKIYENRIESLHNHLMADNDILDYFKAQRAILKALTVTMNDAKIIICLEVSVRGENLEYISYDGLDNYLFSSHIGCNLEEMQIKDSMMRSTLRAMWWHAEALLAGEEKKPHGIHFQKASTRKKRNRANREIIINQTICDEKKKRQQRAHSAKQSKK